MISLGQWLREEREARSISLEEIAAATKIVPRYLEALEDDRLDLMPGGFFVRGIIRSYAKAVGLDPEAVLARFKDAGSLAPPERGRTLFARPAAPTPTLPHAEPAPAEAPFPADEAEVPAEPPAAEAVKAEPALVIEEAARPRPFSETHKAVLRLALRGLAGLCVLGVVLVLWSPWRHRPAAPSENPPSQKTEGPAAQVPGAAPSTAGPAAAEPAAPKPEPAPAAEAYQGLTIEIVFEAETWMQVYADGQIQVDGLFPAGATAQAHAGQKLLIHTGNAGGFTFKLNGRPAKPLGRSGVVLTDVKITLENIKDFLEAPSAGPPAD